jgi:hypothetical protein
MNTDRIINIATSVVVVTAFVMVAWHCNQRIEIEKITDAQFEELEKVHKALKKQTKQITNDVSLERKPYGWKCVDLKTKKIYNIKWEQIYE